MDTLTLRGRVVVHPRGFGFVDDGDVSAFVTPPVLNPFLADDVVECKATQGDDGRWMASDLALVDRPRVELYGTVVSHRGAAHLKVDREVANTDWPLDDGGVTFTVGDHLLARVEGKTAVALRVLEGDDRALTRVVARHAIPTEFSPAAVSEAESARAIPHALDHRRDLRDVPTVTIDAPSTRDIDDAIAVLPADGDGALRLLVSIADVGRFVPMGGPLDADARARGTSVYLAGRVIPMLPDGLSSDWISLLPGVERSCLTAELRIDDEGRVTAVDVYESLIRSWARLNYDEVAAFLDRGEVSTAMEPVRDAAPWFRTVSARLALARARRGGVEINRDEARVSVDAAGVSVEGVKANSAHLLIERCMVAANEAIATWLRDRGVPGVYRVHDSPSPEAVRDLDEFATNFGFAPGFGERLTPLALAAFDRQISAMPSEAAIRGVLLRSLGPSALHGAPFHALRLAAPLYLHFTSPIRRYADLAVHRMIRAYLHGERAWRIRDEEVESLAAHLNARSRGAARAETDRRRMLLARYMGERVGQTFTARVVKARPFGVVAQIDTTLIEGTIPLEKLPEGPYTLAAREGAVVSSTRRFAVGMPVTVKVVSADEALGRVEFALVEG
ncbi:MAG: ribonuclease R [Polyangiales bacterium]